MKKTLSISYYTQFTRRETCLFFESNGGGGEREKTSNERVYTHIRSAAHQSHGIRRCMAQYRYNLMKQQRDNIYLLLIDSYRTTITKRYKNNNNNKKEGH